jgi:hypothetical protein
MIIEIGSEVVCKSTGRHYRVTQITDSSILLEMRLIKSTLEVTKEQFETDFRLEW